MVSALLLVCRPFTSAAQVAVSRVDFSTGSPFEDYLRAIQVAGIAPFYPWSVRGLSPATIERLALADSTGPWNLGKNLDRAHFALAPIAATLILNTSYPYGHNDGPLWAGRGLTLGVSAGVAGRLGPLSFTVVPVAFRAANTAFSLLPNGKSGALAFNDGRFPDYVDLPQRFGNGPYSRTDLGSTQVRFDSRFLSAGLSTANEWIGPATEYPFLLSDNAPGFPHLFVTADEPWNLWFVKVLPRVMWGKLYQSPYSPASGSATYTGAQSGTERLMASGQLSLTPRGIPGLEFGIARFFHVPNRPGRPDASFWKKPFKVFFLKNEYAQGDTVGADNQLAAFFFRWVFQKAGLEVFGERGYEDQFYDIREFFEDSDHDRAYSVGFQKTFARPSGALDVLRFEAINYQLSTLARLRPGEGAVYLHSPLVQGHTNRGQLLGASAGVNAAAASVIEWTRYSHSGRTSWFLRRIVRADEGNFYVGGNVNPRASDVLVAAEAERMWFGRHADLTAKMGLMQEFNRNFSKDQPNLNIQIGSRFHAW